MPIKEENKNLYPENWKWLSLKIRVERAKNHCEKCGVKNGKAIEGKIGRVVLTVAHLDQNPENNIETNLKALCQKCHLNHDRPFNIQKRREAGNYRHRNRK